MQATVADETVSLCNRQQRFNNGGAERWQSAGTDKGEYNMRADIVRRVKDNPKFSELVDQRRKYSWNIAISMLVIYFAFILLVAFGKQFLAIKLGATLTLAFPLGLIVILAAILLTGIYVVRANSVYDRLTREIVEESR